MCSWLWILIASVNYSGEESRAVEGPCVTFASTTAGSYRALAPTSSILIQTNFICIHHSLLLLRSVHSNCFFLDPPGLNSPPNQINSFSDCIPYHILLPLCFLFLFHYVQPSSTTSRYL